MLTRFVRIQLAIFTLVGTIGVIAMVLSTSGSSRCAHRLMPCSSQEVGILQAVYRSGPERGVSR